MAVGIGGVVRLLFAVGYGGPLFTRDVVRGVLTGRAVWTTGISAAGRPLLATFPWATNASGVPWPDLPYNYPPVPVGFYSLVAALGGGTVLARLLLTLSEAGCAGLVGKLTGKRGFGVVYWLSPLSMWWTSHEGQFETLQSLLSLGALATMRWPMVCGILLALAVQTKLTAIALLPFLAWSLWKRHRLRSFIAGGVIGSTPTIVISFVYPIVPNVFRYSAQFRRNPYYWNPVDTAQDWSHQLLSMRVLPQVLSLVFVGWLLAVCRDRNLRARASAAVGFTVFLKFYPQMPSWYLVTMPTMLVPLVLQPRFRLDREMVSDDGAACASAVPLGHTGKSHNKSMNLRRFTSPSAVAAITFIWTLAFSADAFTLRLIFRSG